MSYNTCTNIRAFARWRGGWRVQTTAEGMGSEAVAEQESFSRPDGAMGYCASRLWGQQSS
jgi:hypothetical protein